MERTQVVFPDISSLNPSPQELPSVSPCGKSFLRPEIRGWSPWHSLRNRVIAFSPFSGVEAWAERPQNVRTDAWSSSFEYDGAVWTVPMPGVHNAENAFNAVRLARAIGADTAALKLALSSFPGVERRLQKVGMCGNAVVVDDYAHNPAKLAAMWSALSAAFPAGVAVVWRPHGYGPLRKMLTQLADTFRKALRPQDALLLLPVYDAGGTADRSVVSEHLSAALAGSAGIVECISSLDAAEERIRELAPRMGAVVTAGARDPGLPLLAKKLAAT